MPYTLAGEAETEFLALWGRLLTDAAQFAEQGRQRFGGARLAHRIGDRLGNCDLDRVGAVFAQPDRDFISARIDHEASVAFEPAKLVAADFEQYLAGFPAAERDSLEIGQFGPLLPASAGRRR